MKTAIELCMDEIQKGKTLEEIKADLKKKGFSEEMINNAYNEAEIRLKEKKDSNEEQHEIIKHMTSKIEETKHTKDELSVADHDEHEKGALEKKEKSAPWIVMIFMVLVLGSTFFIFTKFDLGIGSGLATESVTGKEAKIFCLQHFQDTAYYPGDDPEVSQKSFCDGFKDTVFFEDGTDQYDKAILNNCKDITFVKTAIKRCQSKMKSMHDAFAAQ